MSPAAEWKLNCDSGYEEILTNEVVFSDSRNSIVTTSVSLSLNSRLKCCYVSFKMFSMSLNAAVDHDTKANDVPYCIYTWNSSEMSCNSSVHKYSTRSSSAKISKNRQRDCERISKHAELNAL